MTDLPTGNYLSPAELGPTPYLPTPEPPRPIRVSSLRPLRINSVGLKIIYIVVGSSIVGALNLLVFAHIPLPWVRVFPNAILQFLWMGVAVRSFRGIDEPLWPKRALWRMTAKPTAGFVLGSLMLLAVPTYVMDLAKDPAKYSWESVTFLTGIFWAVAYFNSSIRLVRINRAATRAASA